MAAQVIALRRDIHMPLRRAGAGLWAAIWTRRYGWQGSAWKSPWRPVSAVWRVSGWTACTA